MQESRLPDNAWVQFMGQHGIALPSGQFGAGTLLWTCFGEEGFAVWMQVVLCSLPSRAGNRTQPILFSSISLASEIGMI